MCDKPFGHGEIVCRCDPFTSLSAGRNRCRVRVTAATRSFPQRVGLIHPSADLSLDVQWSMSEGWSMTGGVVDDGDEGQSPQSFGVELRVIQRGAEGVRRCAVLLTWNRPTENFLLYRVPFARRTDPRPDHADTVTEIPSNRLALICKDDFVRWIARESWSFNTSFCSRSAIEHERTLAADWFSRGGVVGSELV